MVRRLTSAIGRLVGGASTAALSSIGELGRSVNDDLIVSLIERLADRFEPVTVPVACVPTGPTLDDYRLEVDMHDFEAALQTERFVRPRIEVSAASMEIDRTILTDRLIETFSTVLVRHEERMRSLETKQRARIEKEQWKLTGSLTGMTVDFFVNAALLALIGLGALVGPLFWLLVAFGGISILAELPSLAWSILKRAVGIREGEEKELHELRQQLERYRPLLQRMVERATVIEDPDLAETLGQHIGVDS